MQNAPMVIALALIALVVIYFLPWIDEKIKRAYGRWRRKRRDRREQRMR
ncbi:hypothetical protein CA606_20205 [Caulobacter vibrioides]|uniref:Uncharacterized protein n=1 Tax=Caulobacter vibrioides TaxID=155892 RepID=A0A2S1B7M3_CAUVI|nr:hypothetical protein [Caulobacter vibrioides]AWC68661.1 hypothetical protein CA606_20205 [Caulobacter vibrioides]